VKLRARYARLGSAPACAPAARPTAVPRPTTPEPVLDPTLGDHVDRLYRAAWALSGSREDAEDLVQGTYARVPARPPAPRNDDDLAFLLRALLDSFVSGRSTARLPRPAGGEPAAPGRRDALSAIAALPAEFRDALVAVDVAGLSYGDAANALGIGEVTLASRLFRARSELAQSLSKPQIAKSRDRASDYRMAVGRKPSPRGSSMGMATNQTCTKGLS
jgi:RNA polymerase sigma-70 factor (ECF subfamily)